MKYLRKFNENHSLWKEIDYSEYARYINIEEFSQKEIDDIKNAVNPTDRNIHFSYDQASERIEIEKSKRISGIGVCGTEFEVDIYKLDDQWFLVSDRTGPRHYYKCDDIVGVIQILNTIIK